jgi:hypothetical protein
VEGGDSGVDLDPVAGRQQHNLGHVRAVQQRFECLGTVDLGQLIEQINRRVAVRRAHHDHIHAAASR